MLANTARLLSMCSKAPMQITRSIDWSAIPVSASALSTANVRLVEAEFRSRARANAIMPGLMNTPMAIEGISTARGIPKEELISQRDARVPLGSKMGTAWDVAYAALFLASDEAKFITGVILPVDGGQSARIG